MMYILDIDECSEGVDNCSSVDNRKCNNTNGGFECVCEYGYEENSSGTCVGKEKYSSVSGVYAKCINILLTSDIDECLAGIDLCEQTCTNTPGSYECSCHPGFDEDGSVCIGIIPIIV